MDSKTETVSDFRKDIAEVGDIMIADFIGKRVWDKELMKDGRDQQWNLPMCIGYYPTIKTMKFKTSWDWIMPVVSSIESLMPTIKIPEHLEQLKNGTHGSEPYVEVISLSIASPITEVYRAVVEFIRWYNGNK